MHSFYSNFECSYDPNYATLVDMIARKERGGLSEQVPEPECQMIHWEAGILLTQKYKY